MRTFLSVSVTESPADRSGGGPDAFFWTLAALAGVDALPPPVLPDRQTDVLNDRTVDREQDAIEDGRNDMEVRTMTGWVADEGEMRLKGW